jgi:hypothetical protein
MGGSSLPDPGSTGVKFVRTLTVTFSALMLVGLGASPAFAVGAGTPKPWHYWIAPILGISFVGIFVAIMVGYYIKVFRPKYRGR